MNADRKNILFQLSLWATLILALGPLWLSSGEVWDGVIGAYGFDRNTYAGIYEWLVPSNWGLVYLILRGVGWVSSVIHVEPWLCVKLLLTGSVIGISREVYKLCRDLLSWSEFDSRATVVLVLSFPCWYMLYGSTFIYVVFIWSVLVGHRWMHQGTRLQVVAGFFLVLLSFQVNSNFVMVFALEAARWCFRKPDRPWCWRRSALVMGSAVVVYLMLRYVFPPDGTAVGYNNILVPVTAQAFVALLRAVLMYLTWVPLVFAPACIAWLLVGRGSVARKWDAREITAIVVLLVGAPLSYIAVGKGPPLFVLNLPLDWLGAVKYLGREIGPWIYTTADGWSSRHAFMLSIPASIAAVWAVRMALGSNLAAQKGQRTRLFCIFCAVLVNLAFMTDGHIAKLTRMAQQESIISALRERLPPQPGRVELVLSPPPPWTVWTYEANYWMWRAYGRAAWATFAHSSNEPLGELMRRDLETAEANPALRDYYLMSDYIHSDCATVLTVQLSSAVNAWERLGQLLGARNTPPATIELISSNCAAR